MELRDTLKRLRSELGITQMELAAALHVSFTTVSRWELGKTCPNRSMGAALLQFATDHAVSVETQRHLRLTLRDVKKDKLGLSNGTLHTIEHTSLCQLIEDSFFPLYVCDLQTDEILYMNRQAEQLMGQPLEEMTHRTCYACLMNRASPCEFCRKNDLAEGRLSTFKVVLPDGSRHIVQGKLIKWNGRRAQVRYITNLDTIPENGIPSDRTDRLPGGVAVFELGNSGGYATVYKNAAFESLFDFGKSTAGNDLLPSLHPDDRQAVRQTADKLRSGQDRFDIRFRVSTLQGDYRWIRGIGTVVKRTTISATVYGCFADITDIMVSELEQNSTRAMLHLAMKIAGVHVWRYNCRTREITDSGTLGFAFDLPKVMADMPQAAIRNGYIHKDSVTAFCELYAEANETTTLSRDIRATMDHGKSYVWLRQILTPLLDDKGQYCETIGTSLDITEQKEREETYQEQRRINQLLSRNAEATAQYNLTQNTIMHAESHQTAFLKVLSSGSPADVLNVIGTTILNPDEAAKWEKIRDRNALIARFREGKTHFCVLHRMQNDSRCFKTTIDLLQNPRTRDLEALLTLYDVTEHVTAHEIVRTLARIDYETITAIDADTGKPHSFSSDHMNEVIAEQTRCGDYVAGVSAYLRRYCADADVERVIRQTSLPYVKEQLKTHSVFTVTYSLHQNGGRVHKRVIYAYLDESHTVILCAMQDLTETYRQEEEQKKQLASALQTAEEASRAKTDFVSRMSHDMRTPMNGILGLAMLSANEENADILRTNLTKIKESGNYLLNLINDTLDFQKIESGRMKLNYQITSAKAVFENILDIIRPAAVHKGLDFGYSPEFDTLDFSIRTDPIRIRQIFVNLLSNAIRYTPSGGKVFLGYQRIGRHGTLDYVCIRVRDTGIGMSKEFIENGLYKPFSQENTSWNEEYAGTGLGLSIVHNIVELMGGNIEVESHPGDGTEFAVFLDFERVDEAQAKKAEAVSATSLQTAEQQLAGKRILLAEDNVLNAEIVCRLLEKFSCSVTWVKNGKAAVELFASGHEGTFDLVLMDIHMPVMDGLEATRQLRALNRADATTIPVLAMTANAYDEDVRKSLAAGMNAHLSKPIDPQVLLETLARFCSH